MPPPPVDQFPHPESAGPDGLLAMGGDLHPQTLIRAYNQGIFPWPIEGLPLTWFSPEERAILRFDQIHIPKSLQRRIKKRPFRLTINQAFQQVIENCAEVERPIPEHMKNASHHDHDCKLDHDHEQGHSHSGAEELKTWITDEMLEAYCRLHQMGYAHSVESWEGDQLVGGIYGVCTKGVFSAESMFYLQPDASKIALIHLVEYLQSRGAEWMDIQMMTPHMKMYGAQVLSRSEFQKLLKETQNKKLNLFDLPEVEDLN